MTMPTSVLADGNLKVVHVGALANPGAPTVLELNAASVLDVSSYLTPDGYTPGTDEAVVNDDRLPSRQTYEKPGRFTDTLGLRYVYRPQDPAGTDNKAFHTLKHLVTGFIVVRWGLAFETAFAAGQTVDVIPAQYGIQSKQPPEANSVLKIAQKVFITGTVRRDVAVAA